MEVIELNIDYSLILTFCSHQSVLYCTVFYSIKTQRRFIYDAISLKYDRLPISSLLFASVLIKAREHWKTGDFGLTHIGVRLRSTQLPL